MHSYLASGFAICLAVGTVTAQDANPLASLPLPLDVSLVRQVNPGMTPALHVFIAVGDREYALQMPDGFRMQNDPTQGRILFQRTDNSCWITFRIIRATSGTGLTASTCKDWLLNEHPTAKIIGETSVTAAGQGGSAYDVTWKAGGGLTQTCRTAYVPCAMGILEFTVNSSADNFASAVGFFKNILTSFRICLNGTRDIPPLSKDS